MNHDKKAEDKKNSGSVIHISVEPDKKPKWQKFRKNCSARWQHCLTCERLSHFYRVLQSQVYIEDFIGTKTRYMLNLHHAKIPII